MIKYVGVAWILKIFSISPPFYRLLGNTVGKKNRIKVGLWKQYLGRVKDIYEFCKRYDVKDGDQLLELGTGWIHWESILFRLFRDVKCVLFDVWDNRQLSALQKYVQDLDLILDQELDLSPEESKKAHQVIQQILSATFFEELYDEWGWRYIVEPSGKLSHLEGNYFDLAYSANVGEHIQAEIVSEYIKDLYRIIKPGGISFQSIDPGDHLSYYTKGVSHKNYLKYSDLIWKLFFENRVQYFNRISASEWMTYFDDAGFKLIEDFSIYDEIESISVHEQYASLSVDDINCLVLKVVHQKQK